MGGNTEGTRFYNQLKKFGLKRLIISLDLALALSILVFYTIDRILNTNIFNPKDINYIIAIFAAASTLFAITLAALAIIFSFSSSNFMKFLKSNNMHEQYIFIFWLGNSSYLAALVLSSAFLVINIESFRSILYPLIIAIFTYALVNTFYILGAVIRFGLFLSIYDSK